MVPHLSYVESQRGVAPLKHAFATLSQWTYGLDLQHFDRSRLNVYVAS
eukprot:COSAG04_NODE_1552_length_6377_cov_253.592959_1_plen_47_part_10